MDKSKVEQAARTICETLGLSWRLLPESNHEQAGNEWTPLRDQFRDAARAVIADALAWQPIKSVPKDSRTVLIYDPVEGVALAYWGRGSKCWLTLGEMRLFRPTHWAPLPPLPGQENSPS